MEIRLLGPLEVQDGDRVIAIPRRQQRALLAALALRAGEVLSTDRLITDVWGERAPASAIGSLQNTVSALRKALGPSVLVTKPPGYRLAIEPEGVDANRFERLRGEALGADPEQRVALLTEALALWHGPALADLDEEQSARLGGLRLDELRVVALEERLDAELLLGRHAGLVGELQALVAAHPFRERLRVQLMLALYRCGRQTEALEVYRAARLAADELGLDPWPELQKLERQVLQQDPGLAPPGEAEHEATAPAAERRLVTVLVATPPGDDDPETLRRRLDEVLTTARDVLERYDGALERFGPEGLVAVFGGDTPRDDDAPRAVRAAAELGLPAGIATGESVDGAGSVFTRAAELARGSGVQADERTRALVQHERRLDAPLVGRTEELRRLRVAFDVAATERRCRVVTVLGEPGIGKTRLGRELVESLAGAAHALVGRCVSYGKGLTFMPLVDALRDLDVSATLASDPDGELASARLAALAGATDAGTLGESYWAVRRLLEALARTRPVLLLLDDVHWAEPALLDLVDYLGERITDAPLLLVNLARPELARPAGEQIPLGPLSDEESRELVAGVAELDEETLARVVALAEGNALYAEQLASFAAEGGEGLPPTLEAVLAGRLGRLADSERAVLQRAAVAGREFSRGIVAALSEVPVDGALASLSRRSFVHPAGAAERGDAGYRFHHVLLRDAAYATLTKPDRATLHERTAAWLDRDGSGDDALVGYHLEQVVLYRRGLGENADELAEAAGERLGEAGMRVWRTQDARAATGLLRRSTALLPAGRRRAELLWELALALWLENAREESGLALDRAEADAADAGARSILARTRVERTHLSLLSGDLALADVAAELTAAVAELERERDERGLGRAHSCLAMTHAFAFNMGEYGRAGERAAIHYRAAGFPPSVGLGIQAEGLYFGSTPVPDALRRCTDLLREPLDRMSEANITGVLGGLQALVGEFEEARRLLDHSRALYDDLGNRRIVHTAWDGYHLEVEMLAGNIEGAATHSRQSVAALLDGGEPAHATTRAGQLAAFLLDADRVEEAEQFAQIAEEGAVESDVFAQILWRGVRATLLARHGKHEEAEALARGALAISALTDALRERARVHLALAEVLMLSHKDAEAQHEVAEARALLIEKGATALLPRVEALRAALA